MIKRHSARPKKKTRYCACLHAGRKRVFFLGSLRRRDPTYSRRQEKRSDDGRTGGQSAAWMLALHRDSRRLEKRSGDGRTGGQSAAVCWPCIETAADRRSEATTAAPAASLRHGCWPCIETPQTGEAKRRRPHRRPVCGMDVGLAKQLTSLGFYANIVYCLIMKKSALLGRPPSFRHVEHYRPNYQGVNNVNDKKQDQTY